MYPFWGLNPGKTHIYGAWIGVFKPNLQNIKTLSKLLRRFRPDFCSDKDQQILFSAWSKHAQDKSKMPFWKKIEILLYISNGLTIGVKFGILMHIGPLRLTGH